MLQDKHPPFPPNRDWRFVSTMGLILLAILGTQLLSHGSVVVPRNKLAEFPNQLGVWKKVSDVPIDERSQQVLGATDLLNRVYYDATTQRRADLFIGFFASQRKGGAIHSPKNCLPGAGWEPVKGAIIPMTIPEIGRTVSVNEYIVQNGLQKQLVLYWYQSQGRTIASEYSVKAYLIWDAIRRHRTDGALVRVIAPVSDGNEVAALSTVTSFVQTSFTHLFDYLPN